MKKSLRKIRFLLFVFTFLFLLLFSVPVMAKTKKIKFTKTSVVLKKGQTKTIKAKGKKYRKLRVRASKKGYVKLTVRGKKIRIRALRAGTVKLYVRGYSKKGRLIGKRTIKVRIKAPVKKKKTTAAKKNETKKETAKKESDSKDTKTTTAASQTKKTAYVYSKESANIFLKAVKKVADYARNHGWYYDDSHATPPCSDGKIACDRIIARALYNLGYTDQPSGGITIYNMAPYLAEWGFVKSAQSKILPGAVVAVADTVDMIINHVFVVSKYDSKTKLCDKYDTGSDWRIQSVQPFRDVPLVEWSERSFLYAYNVPYAIMGTAAYTNAQKKKTTAYVYKGVDYSAVYNYNFYRTKYDDLRKAFGNDEAAYFTHFLTYGMKEGRKACAGFTVDHYQSRYGDLRKLYGSDLPEYYKHYCLYGKAEGRNGL